MTQSLVIILFSSWISHWSLFSFLRDSVIGVGRFYFDPILLSSELAAAVHRKSETQIHKGGPEKNEGTLLTPVYDKIDFISKPGRQIVTFLILCNFGLWITYNFEIQKVIQCNIICRENNDFSGKCHSWSTAVLWILSLDYHSEGNTPDMRVFQVQYDNILSL